MSNIILDIETVPLPKERIQSFKDTFEPKTEKKTKAKKKSSLGGLHFLTGRVVCAGVKQVDKEWHVFADEDEAVIFAGLVDYLEDHKPIYLIHFNGNTFDLPFLRLRGALYGYDMTRYINNSKYSKQNLDIYEALGGKWSLNAKLAEYAWYFGLDTISDSGADVERMYKEDDWDGIVAHNVGDLITTEELYKRLFFNR
jgi:DNA polymerase elongation subunit (family B)